MKNFKKYYLLNASPEEVYIAFTNPLTIELWTNQKAVMPSEPGQEFSWLDGNITGKNIHFVPNKELVQTWDFGDETESKVILRFHEHKKGTSIELQHTNIPDEAYSDMVEGWDDVIFGNLEEYFADL
ncbi:MAG: SRPBCC domain-containing protein [Bacteroidia bacterium]|nr:SRPBCC domain-containing protein [Bacteroidia bacterium]